MPHLVDTHLLKLSDVAIIHDYVLASILGDSICQRLLQCDTADDAGHRQPVVCCWVECVELAVPRSSANYGSDACQSVVMNWVCWLSSILPTSLNKGNLGIDCRFLKCVLGAPVSCDAITETIHTVTSDAASR